MRPPPKPLWGKRRRYNLSDLGWHTITDDKYYIRLRSSPVRGQCIQVYKGRVSREGLPLNPESITEFTFASLAGDPVIFDGVIELHSIAMQPAEAQRHVDVRRLRGYTGRGR